MCGIALPTPSPDTLIQTWASASSHFGALSADEGRFVMCTDSCTSCTGGAAGASPLKPSNLHRAVFLLLCGQSTCLCCVHCSSTNFRWQGERPSRHQYCFSWTFQRCDSAGGRANAGQLFRKRLRKRPKHDQRPSHARETN